MRRVGDVGDGGVDGVIEYVDRIQSRVALIDGARLAGLNIRYGVGVQVTDTFSIVEVDEDYFE